MKKHYSIILTLIITLLLISACVQSMPIVVETNEHPAMASTNEATVDILEKKGVPTPHADSSRVCGTIVYGDQVPFVAKTIFLAPVYEETAIVLDTSSSPAARTDIDGFFCTAEIPPGEYALVIGSPEEAYEIYTEDSKSAVVFTAEAGKILDLGQLVTKLLP